MAPLRYWRIPALLLLCTSAICQQPLETGIVSGTVFLADTGAPAAGAIVSLLPIQASPVIDPKTGEYVLSDQPQRGDFHDSVNTTGSFEISGVKPGEYYVLTYRPGYISQDSYINSGGANSQSNPGRKLPAFVQQIRIAPGATEQVNLVLQRGGEIRGSVRLSDGQPIVGAAVSVEIKTQDGTLVRSGGAAHTDSNGHFEISGLAPGSYAVFAAISGPMVTTARGSAGSGGQIILCCSTVRGTQARLIDLRGTEIHDNVNIVFPATGLHTVSGKVVSTSGTAITAGIVRLYPNGEPGLSRATPLQPEGQFSFDNVSDEEYTISFESEAETQIVGFTPDQKGVIMRRGRPPFLPVSKDIRVAGEDLTSIVLTASHNIDADLSTRHQ